MKKWPEPEKLPRKRAQTEKITDMVSLVAQIKTDLK